MESKFELLQKLQIAANFNVESTCPTLFHLLGYRQRIAEQMIIEMNDENSKFLEDIFERINHDIKLVLGI